VLMEEEVEGWKGGRVEEQRGRAAWKRRERGEGEARGRVELQALFF
jgi:hypothetical protein